MDLKSLAETPFLKRYLLWPSAAIAIFAVLGFFVLPPIVKSVAVGQLSKKLHRPVAIRAIRINPFALSVKVEGFSMKDRDGEKPFVSFEELYLNIEAASVVRGGPVLREISLRSPSVTIVRNEDSTYNFSDILDELTAGPPKEGEPLRYSLNNIVISGGSVDFDDRPKHTRHTVKDISVGVPFLSNLPSAVNVYVHPAFEANVNGTMVGLKGTTRPYSPSRETSVDLSLRDLDIPHYLEYSPVPLGFKVLSGALDVKTVLTFAQPAGGPPAVALSGSVTLKKLSIADLKGAPVLTLPSMSAGIASAEPLSRRAKLDNVVVSSPELFLVRGKSGEFNVSTLAQGRGGPPEKEKPPAGAMAKSGADEGKTGTEPPFSVEVAAIRLSGGKVSFDDLSPEDPVALKISPLDVTFEKFSTEKDSRGNLSVTAVLNRKGKVAVKGELGVNPVSADLSMDLRGIDLVPFQPYFTDRINISLTGGSASVKGKLTVAARDDAMRTAYAGDVSVTGLATVDKTASEDFIKWNSLHLGGVSVGTSPLAVSIRQVALTDFYARVIVLPDATLNLQGIVKKEGERPAGEAAAGTHDNATAAKPTESPAKPTPISIETVTFQGGRIDFTDRFIKPNYSANLLEIGGRVSGLSTEETRMAEVDLRGKLENYAPLEITGKINPLRNDLFVDLKVDFKDMDLSPLTPYSGRYAGYAIEKGKLSLGLKYTIVAKKLDASNNVFIDQFTFGEAVESPDATRLPVRLAVALLKNRKGEISLDIPVSGSLDDPQFSVWSIVVKIILNLLVKAATSPFALLGALFGGGEELSYLEFDYGRETPDGPGEAKLKTLVKALHERPSLKLEIAGHADMEKDREALRRSMFDRKVRSQKIKDLVKKGVERSATDNVVVDAGEYPEYLKRAYREEKFPKPRNVIGMAKDLPVPEMEKLMYAHIQVTDDDLRLLAQKRARATRDYLVASKQVEPERVFLVEPKTPAPEKKEKLRDSRVEFVLK